ncbi:glycoside hydrolase family 64 protein [Thermocrispum municipale]|uniref:glycoside hydrolase family 64 protein n=1 Tax=Thermocrispum municipale TaxID=37926 RepID=UPI00041D7931|nr:glycoside hydrolase family 64 protein [Thermocrispum municipale]
MRVRTKWFGALAAVAAGIAASAIAVMPSASAQSAAAPDKLPVTVTNDSGRSEQVHLYVLGIKDGQLGYVDQAGDFSAWPPGSNPPSPAPDVSIPGPAAGESTTVNIPKGLSGRIYMSFGDELEFFLTPDGLVQPAPWNPSDPNHDILFDWSELTYNDEGLWLNSTQVDMFAVPHAVSVTGADGTTQTRGELKPGGRNAVFDGLRDQAGWGDTIVTRGDGTVLRALAPGKAAEAGLLDANYLDPYIDQAWNAYTDKDLTVVPFADQPDTKFIGRTSGSTMAFTDTSGQQVATFDKPSTADVWGCDGNLHAPNDEVVGPIARTLCAALHRGTLHKIDVQPGGDPAADFYREDLTNHYSRLIHENMVDGRAYGFPFDDVMAQESLVHDGNPQSAAITLTSFE